MPKETIFISSVQKEFAQERHALAAYIREDELLKFFFEPHSSYPHNPLLANCMFLTGAIERYGTGIPEMYKLTAETGLKAPDFEDNKTFLVTLWRPSAKMTDHHTDHDADHDGDYDGDYDTDHDKRYIEIAELPKRLLWIMKGEVSRSELMQILELKHNPTFRENYLDPAIQSGWIEMTIPEKPQSKKQKYRLTQLGKQQIDKIKNESK